MRSIFLAAAMRATFSGFPFVFSLWYTALMEELYRAAASKAKGHIFILGLQAFYGDLESVLCRR